MNEEEIAATLAFYAAKMLASREPPYREHRPLAEHALLSHLLHTSAPADATASIDRSSATTLFARVEMIQGERILTLRRCF
jgi:hypothetical protein